MKTNDLIFKSEIGKDLDMLKRIFVKNNVKFAVTGSLALAMHGLDFHMMTMIPHDIDVIVENTPNVNELLETLVAAYNNQKDDGEYPESTVFTFRIGNTIVNAWIDQQDRFADEFNSDLSYFKFNDYEYPIVGICTILKVKYGYGRKKDYVFNKKLQDLFNFYLR